MTLIAPNPPNQAARSLVASPHPSARARYAARLGRPHLCPLDVLVLEELALQSAQAGHQPIATGVVALAAAVGAPRRSLERSLERLRDAKMISSRRRGDGAPAVISVLETASAATLSRISARAPLALSAPKQGPSGVVVPIGFVGEEQAYEIAMILSRVHADESAVDLANRYLEHIGPEEALRLESLRDEDGLYVSGALLVGDARVDEGLRQVAFAAHGKRNARAFLRGLAPLKAETIDLE